MTNPKCQISNKSNCKLKLETLFDVLAFIHSRSPESAPAPDLSRLPSPNLISQHLFVESFIILGLELKFKGERREVLESYASGVAPQKSIFHRIAFLLHIMNDSEGLRRLGNRGELKHRVDLIRPLRAKFPEYILD